MNNIDKSKIVHGYNDFELFKLTEKMIESVEMIRSKTINFPDVDYSLREIDSRIIKSEGKSYLMNYFDFHDILYLPTDKRSVLESNKSRISPNVLAMFYSKKISPFELPVEFKYKDYFAGDLVTTYDFSDDINVLKKMKIYFEKILLSSYNSIINISSYVHELVHTQVEKKDCIKDSNNSEVLSIFMELLFLKDYDSTMLLQYIGILNRLSYMLLSYDILKSSDDLVSNYNNAKYFVSSCKAFCLYDKYSNSNSLIQNEILRNIQGVFDGYITVEEFLEFFDITVENGLYSINKMII